MQNNVKFHFYSEFILPVLLGKKASNLTELLNGIRSVPAESIYYHTHKFLKQHHYLIPEPPNDFAYWVRNILVQSKISELIASIDIAQFNTIEDVRSKLISVLEKYNDDTFSICCNRGLEFQFMSCKKFLFKTKYEASNIEEFTDILKCIDVSTFYVNIFDSKLREGTSKNRFAEWFESIGYPELSEKISKLDPYTMTLESLRNKILILISAYGKY